MKIILTGGGTGGHTTPLIAVGEALKDQYGKDAHLVVIAERTAEDKPILRQTKTYRIHAGKLRRYHNEGFFQQLRDVRTVWSNIKDILKVMRGFWQSIRILLKEKPDIIFIKGGYVSLPVGVAARLLHIPYVTHDSDVQPGLTNRLLAGGAAKNLVGFPKEQYAYDELKSEHVGVPVRRDFASLSKTRARKVLGIPPHQKRVLIVGGSLGARRINNAIIERLDSLIAQATIYHISGPGEYERVDTATAQKRKRSKVVNKKYILSAYEGEHMAHHLAAADIVVTRAGATLLSEAAALKKPLIVIPNPYLTEGHQLKNAAILNTYDAAEIVQESELDENSSVLAEKIKRLLGDNDHRVWLGRNLQTVFMPDAAARIATAVYSAGEPKQR